MRICYLYKNQLLLQKQVILCKEGEDHTQEGIWVPPHPGGPLGTGNLGAKTEDQGAA